MNGIILYGSRYGAARQYAQALEERTGLPAVSYAEVRDFGPFDTIVYVGGLYAGKTTGLAKTARRCPQTIPSACWWPPWAWRTRPTRTICSPFGSPWPRSSPPASLSGPPHVPLRGAIDYQALSTKHRLMMKGLCAILRRQPVTERTADTQALLDSYGNAVSFIDFDTLAPIEAWLKKG